MVTKEKRSQNTVKIDEKLLERVKKLFDDDDIKIEYPTVKSFINVAVLKLLKEKEGIKTLLSDCFSLSAIPLLLFCLLYWLLS